MIKNMNEKKKEEDKSAVMMTSTELNKYIKKDIVYAKDVPTSQASMSYISKSFKPTYVFGDGKKGQNFLTNKLDKEIDKLKEFMHIDADKHSKKVLSSMAAHTPLIGKTIAQSKK